MEEAPEMPPLGPPQELDASLLSETPPFPELGDGRADSFDLIETPLEGEMRDDTGRLVEEIERLGQDNPEVEGLVLGWYEKWESKTRTSERNPRAQLYRDLHIARVYEAWGRIEEAVEELDGLINRIDDSVYAWRAAEIRGKAVYNWNRLRTVLASRE